MRAPRIIPFLTVVGFSAEHAKRHLEAGARLIFIDLRPAEEFGQGRLPGARSVPLQELNQRYADVPAPAT